MLMERFRHGRMVFIGDAAHAKSPFGARGGNSGVADADNLGWKLQLLLAGRAGPEILDTYDQERHRAAEENIRITSRTGRFMQPRSAMESTLRTAVLQLAREQFLFARGVVNTGRMMAPHHYAGLPAFGPRPEDGKLVPNVPVRIGDRDAGLVDVLRDCGCELAAFVFPEGTTDVEALRRAVAGLPVRLLVVGRDVEDVRGLLAAQCATGPGQVALVRPDSHLAAGVPAEGSALAAAVLRSVGLPVPASQEEPHATRPVVAEAV
jgi:3-(3-hydroxy-phenyl)propionate hydroxylase